MVKNLPANAGDKRDVGLIPGSGKSPGGGQGNPLQCPCLESPMDRGTWWAKVHGVAKSQTQKKRFSPHTHRRIGLGTDTSEMVNRVTSGTCFRDTWGLLRMQSPGLCPSLQQSESLVVEL